MRDLMVLAAMMLLYLEANENADSPGLEPDGQGEGVHSELPRRRQGPFHRSKCFG